MLSAFVNASDMEGAENFFRRLKQDGFRPNVVTYGTLIKGYAKINNLEKMIKKYEEMKVNGIRVNQTILTTIMDAYGKNKDFGSAVIWFKEIGSCGLRPDQKAKNILLSLAKTTEELNEANQLGGYSSQSSNPQRAGKFSRSVAEDEEEEDDELDYADDVIPHTNQRGEKIILNGIHQQNLEQNLEGLCAKIC